MAATSYRRLMEGSQRRALLRVASGYKTVSTKAIQVITGVVPIHLLAEERRALFEQVDGHTAEAKRTAREITLQKWQEEWADNEDTGQWTKKLIPNIRRWVNCKHRTTGYYMTQFLSGHGSFRTYTTRIRKTENSRCLYCGEDNTPEHTMFECNRWKAERLEACLRLDIRLRTDNILETMLQGTQQWNIGYGMINEIMRKKEDEERQHQHL